MEILTPFNLKLAVAGKAFVCKCKTTDELWKCKLIDAYSGGKYPVIVEVFKKDKSKDLIDFNSLGESEMGLFTLYMTT